MRDFIGALKLLLTSDEYKYSEEDAERLIDAHPDVVIGGMMNDNLRATAMALEMKDGK